MGKKRGKYLDKAGFGEIEGEDKDLGFFCKRVVSVFELACVCGRAGQVGGNEGLLP